MDTSEHPHGAIRRAHSLLTSVSEPIEDVNLLECDRCEGPMQVRSTTVNEDPCRNDVRIKCEHCYWWTRHGIPIPRHVYESEMNDRDQRTVDAVATDTDDSDVEGRLEALGYIDR
jgi:hypothetical protein